MKKVMIIVCVIVMCMLALTSCADRENEAVRVLTLKGPTGLGMLELIDKNSGDDKEYDIKIFSSPEDITAEIALGNYDIASLPVNLAPVLYKKTGGKLECVALNTLGVLYIVENGNNITDIQSLKGKTVYCTGGGATPEFIIRYILEKNGLDPDKDVSLDFSFSEHAELAAFCAAGSCEIAMLPEPNVTSTVMSGKEGIRVALDLSEEWEKVSDTKLIQGCIVANKDFAENHKDKLEKFMTDCKASVEFTNNNVKDAASLAEKYGIIPKAALAQKAIPRCNITFIEKGEMKADMKGMLTVLFNAKPQSVGGAMPDDDFYRE